MSLIGRQSVRCGRDWHYMWSSWSALWPSIIDIYCSRQSVFVVVIVVPPWPDIATARDWDRLNFERRSILFGRQDVAHWRCVTGPQDACPRSPLLQHCHIIEGCMACISCHVRTCHCYTAVVSPCWCVRRDEDSHRPAKSFPKFRQIFNGGGRVGARFVRLWTAHVNTTCHQRLRSHDRMAL